MSGEAGVDAEGGSWAAMTWRPNTRWGWLAIWVPEWPIQVRLGQMMFQLYIEFTDILSLTPREVRQGYRRAQGIPDSDDEASGSEPSEDGDGDDTNVIPWARQIEVQQFFVEETQKAFSFVTKKVKKNDDDGVNNISQAHHQVLNSQQNQLFTEIIHKTHRELTPALVPALIAILELLAVTSVALAAFYCEELQKDIWKLGKFRWRKYMKDKYGITEGDFNEQVNDMYKYVGVSKDTP